MEVAEPLSSVLMHKNWSAGDGKLQHVVLQHRQNIKDKKAVDEDIAKSVENQSEGDQVKIIQVLLFHV